MKKWMLWLIPIIFAIGIFVLGICNHINNDKFWEASIYQVITLLMAILITFYATQYKNDQRKVKDYAENVIRKIQAIIVDERFVDFNENTENKAVTMTNRKLNNYISILNEYGKKLGFQKDAEYVAEQFKAYRTFVDEHLSDKDYLSKSSPTLQMYAENIEQKCENIILNLYK